MNMEEPIITQAEDKVDITCEEGRGGILVAESSEEWKLDYGQWTAVRSPSEIAYIRAHQGKPLPVEDWYIRCSFEGSADGRRCEVRLSKVMGTHVADVWVRMQDVYDFENAWQKCGDCWVKVSALAEVVDAIRRF